MDDQQFQTYIDKCFVDLEDKQEYLEESFGFSAFEEYKFDFDKEELYFINGGETKKTATIVPIGSFNDKTNAWVWAWANDAFPADLKTKAERFKELEEITGSNLFTHISAEIDESMSWEIAGMALNLLRGDGVYCNATEEDTRYFYVVSNLKKSYYK
ncbi:DUF6882 domain-containing protein [Leucothrix arctica]|uniref:Uncharacterized protein n=1 Tax=Leucothrix arctica TaxID=1481894 RepID=A0A317C4W2_9GAMM|nr:DUF6882 domain-containing protein [Leucothrix arctica]PWQ93618.1 hypothetical protein DKT75_18545 [Leucothrix arctica]